MLQGLQERTADQELPGIQLVLDALSALVRAQGLRRPDVQELAGIVPFVDGLVDVYALVALQSDERSVEQAGENFRHLGFADPGLSYQEDRPSDRDGHKDPRRQPHLRQVAMLPERHLEL